MAGYDESGGSHPPVLDTADLPPERRLKSFRDLYSEQVMPVRIDPIGDEPFWCWIVSAEFGQVSVSEVAGSPMRCEYEQSDTGRADAGLIVDVVMRGSYRLAQNGRQALGREGGGLLMHSQIAAVADAPCRLETRTLVLPEATVRGAVGDLERLAGLVLDADAAEAKLLRAYVTSLDLLGGSENRAFASTVGRHLTDLVIAGVCRSLRREDPTEGRGVRAARLQRVRALLDKEFANPLLNAARVARTLGVTERYVQKLVEQDGATFSALLMERRLQEAFRMLRDPANMRLSVQEIGWAAGFSDASHFTRAFRRRFGETPGGVRAIGGA